jgi:hypothetical protein
LLREAGALLTIDRPQQLPAAVRLVQRHFRRQSVAESAQVSLPAAIWQRLPWPRLAVHNLPVTP